jgi:diguanylate cyclase (GGDEF)-like protein
MKVLLIEDNPGDARLLREMLCVDSQFAVSTVDRISRGLSCLCDSKFDLILLDLYLPDGEGIDTLRQVHCAARNGPIGVLTVLDDEELACTAIREGAQDYLTKGEIDRQLLVRVLRYACERHRLTTELENMALTDALTGLYNRRGFDAIAEEQLKLARRMGHGVALAFIDLDGMKGINDSLGHEAGDEALVATERVLKSTFRASDIIARLGGDEFVVLIIGSDRSATTRLLEGLQQTLARHNKLARPSLPLSLSVGIAHYNPKTSAPTSIEQLITRADEEMYADKKSRHPSRA